MGAAASGSDPPSCEGSRQGPAVVVALSGHQGPPRAPAAVTPQHPSVTCVPAQPRGAAGALG